MCFLYLQPPKGEGKAPEGGHFASSSLMHYRYDLQGPNLSHPRIFRLTFGRAQLQGRGASMIGGDKFHYLMASIQQRAASFKIWLFFTQFFPYFFSIRWKDGAVRKYTQPTASQYPRKIKLAQLSLCHACAAFFFLVVPHTQMRAKHSGDK